MKSKKGKKSPVQSKDLFAEAQNKKEFISKDNNVKLILPVTESEVAQYWERGYLCHPLIIQHLSKYSDGHKSSSLINFSEIDLKNRYNTKCEFFIEFHEISNEVICNKWVCSINSIKNFIVNSEESKVKLERILVTTKRNFKNEINILIDDTSRLVSDSDNLNSVQEIEINHFLEFDSCLGGILMSSFIERKFMIQGESPFNEIPYFGIFYNQIIDKSNTDNKVVKFIVDIIKDNLTGHEDHYYNKLLELLSSYNDDERFNDLECLFVENPKTLNNFLEDTKFKKVRKHLELKETNDAIRVFVKSNPNDIMPVFYFTLVQYRLIANVASPDIESFVYSLLDNYTTKLISYDQLIVLLFILGYSVGTSNIRNSPTDYGTWKGVSNIKLYDKVILEQDKISDVLSEICGIFNLDFVDNKLSNAKKNQEFVCKDNGKTRKIVYKTKENSISLNDDLLHKFSTKKHLIDSHKDIDSIGHLLEGLISHKHSNMSVDEIKDNIETNIKTGQYTSSLRLKLDKLLDIIA